MHGLYLPFHILQGLAQYQIYVRSGKRRTKYAVSADLTVLSWIWSSALMLASGLYAYSPTVQANYAQRYPLYPEIPISQGLPMAHALQAGMCTLAARRILGDHNRKERLSLLCGVLLSVYGISGLLLCWLYWAGRAKINLLDLADWLSLVGSVSWAVRLIPQVSVAWFQECVPHLDLFIYMQASSLVYGYVCGAVLGSRLAWYDLPIDSPGLYSSALVFLCCCCLKYQSHLYNRSPQGFSM